MKIIAAIKQVPERDAQIALAPSGKWIDEDDLAYTINEPDAYALEEALQLKEKNGGEVIVVCLGPERVASTLREALAKGADRAIHVEFDDLATLDTLAVAKRPACRHGTNPLNERVSSLLCRPHSFNIILENDSMNFQLKGLSSEPGTMALRPMLAGRIKTAVAEQEREQLLTAAHQVHGRIHTRTDQIAQRFVRRVRHPHLR
jgi:hypothetical protein